MGFEERVNIMSLATADPAELPNQPTDSQFIADFEDAVGSSLGRDELTDNERAGFLQTWRNEVVQQAIAELPDDRLDETASEIGSFLDTGVGTSKEFEVKRIVYGFLKNQQALREFKKQGGL